MTAETSSPSVSAASKVTARMGTAKGYGEC